VDFTYLFLDLWTEEPKSFASCLEVKPREKPYKRRAPNTVVKVMNVERSASFCLLTLLVTAPFSHLALASMMVVVENRDVNHVTLYFFNGIVVYDSSTNETLLLETPANLTLGEGFEQRVATLLSYNLVFNKTLKTFTFNATKGYVGFFVCRVEVYAKPMGQVLTLITRALEDPMSTPKPSSSELSEEVREYLRAPNPKVVEVVKPEYERWFRETYGIGIDGAGPLGVAATAAYFVYLVYIKYDPSDIPRSIEQVIESRRGDCDDMSRILVELLNAYGIPAVVAGGYTYIRGLNLTQPMENVTYKYVNGGPHAFVMAYVPSEGWISLDLLAYSLLVNPFAFEGYSREAKVEEEAVEELVSLHRSLNATQAFVLLSEEEFEKLVGEPVTLESVARLFWQVIGVGGMAATMPQAKEVTTTSLEAWYVAGIVVVLVLIAIASTTLIKRSLGQWFSPRRAEKAY
jgi:transglutaminase-like putative cysteine protease